LCNLYSVTKGQQAIRELANAMRDTTGNLPPLPGVFPDYPAPIVRTGADGVRELTKARWGMPSPVFALQGRKVDKASPMSATPRARTVGAGWRRHRAAWCRSPRSARMSARRRV